MTRDYGMPTAQRRLVILGTGGHAKVIIELLRCDPANEIVGCLAPESGTSGHVSGVPWLGEDETLRNLKQQGIHHAFVAIGDNRLRRKLCSFATSAGMRLVNAVSPQASVSPTAKLAGNIAIMHGANVGPDTAVGEGVIINSNASVDHDGRLAAFCHIGPGVTLAGGVIVGEESFVATGSSVIPGQRIGDRALVGAGSVVVRSIPADSIAYGVPARIRKRAHGTAVVPLVSSDTTTAMLPSAVDTTHRKAG